MNTIQGFCVAGLIGAGLWYGLCSLILAVLQ